MLLGLSKTNKPPACTHCCHSVVLHPDTEDGGYKIECPALPGCASQDDTIEEALEMIEDAIEGHIEVAETGKVFRKDESAFQ